MFSEREVGMVVWKQGALALGAGLALAIASSPAYAQVGLSTTFGAGLYGSDAACPKPGATVTTYRAAFETPFIGVSGTFNNEDYPWPPTDDGLSSFHQEEILNHGDALQLAIELFPLRLFGTGARNLSNYLKPFIGVGFHSSKDGEAAPPDANQPLETLGVKGATDLMLTFGAKITVPTGDKFGIRLEMRGNSVFAGEFEEETSSGGTIRVDGKTLTWGEYSVGFIYRVR
jgi:hypothetical protein